MLLNQEKFQKESQLALDKHEKQDSNMDIWLNHSRDLESFKMLGSGSNDNLGNFGNLPNVLNQQDKSIFAKRTFRSHKTIGMDYNSEKKRELKNSLKSYPTLSKAIEKNKKFVSQYERVYLPYKIHKDSAYIPITVTNPYISKLKKKKDYTVKSLTIEKEIPPVNYQRMLESKTSSNFFITEKKLSQQRPKSCNRLLSTKQQQSESTCLLYNRIFNDDAREPKLFRDLKFVPFTGKFKHKPIKIDTGFKTVTLKEKPQSAKVPYISDHQNSNTNLNEIGILSSRNRPSTALINPNIAIRSKLIKN